MVFEWITKINSLIVILFCAMSAYQYIYLIVSLLLPVRRFTESKPHRFAVLICARNEEKVIAQLIDSIHKQDYPAELLDVYVLADNCTDATKEVAEHAGAVVFERQDQTKIGKGYALDRLLHEIGALRGDTYYDGYFVFDADNLLSPDYVRQMNTVFSNGYRVVTSYRNSKNFCHNWVTAGYGLMFLREARYMNNARMILHTSCVISGTGFLVHRDIVNEAGGGWPYHTLTEDLEFSMVQIAKGERIGYCHDAVFFDEQPTKFRQSWSQRIRWCKGFMQAFFKQGGKVIRGVFRPRSAFSCFDEIMSTLPSVILSVFGVASVASMVYSIFTVKDYGFVHFLTAFGVYLAGIYAVNFFLAVPTTITEWKNIYGPTYKKIFYIFTFPIFMMSNIPITLAAFFTPAAWKEIKHADAKTIDDVKVSADRREN